MLPAGCLRAIIGADPAVAAASTHALAAGCAAPATAPRVIAPPSSARHLHRARRRRTLCRSGFNLDSFRNGSDLRRWLGLDPSNGATPQWSMDDDDPRLPPTSSLRSQDGEAAPQQPTTRRRSAADRNGDRGASAAISSGAGAGGNGSGPDGGPPRPSPLGDWSAGIDDDWDDWSGAPAVADLDDDEEVAELREQVIARRQARRGRRTRVRDEYLRPIVDVTGIYNRLAIGEKEAEERVFVEAITNQYESREALRYGAVLLAVPLLAGFAVSRLLAGPLWELAEGVNPQAFALTDGQKVAGAKEMHREEVRLRMEASLGQAPALSDAQMLGHLREEAARFESGMRAANKQALLNVVSDSTTAALLFVILLRDTSQRAILFRTIGRVFTGLSDTAKAFLIILVTDTLLGYHSEEGWTAGLTLLSSHYGWHAERSSLQLFVATVPVLMDALFKYWIFVGLNKIDPAAAVTLRQMDRH